MKKRVAAIFAGLSLLCAFVAFADKGMTVFKAGETIYVCGCGEGCACATMSRKSGKCSCGNQLVKNVVAKVDSDKVYVTVNGKDRSFPAKAKYACACGEKCDCGTVSQKQGTCSCGKEMKEMKDVNAVK